MKAALRRFAATARDWLARRPPRERRLLAAGALALAAAPLYALLAPLADVAAREARLAALQAEQRALHGELAEAARLAALPEAAALAPGALPATLQRALAAAGIDARVEPAGEAQARVAGHAPFRLWLDWLATLRRQVRLRVVEAEFTTTTAAAGDGRVAARIVIEASGQPHERQTEAFLPRQGEGQERDGVGNGACKTCSNAWRPHPHPKPPLDGEGKPSPRLEGRRP